MRSKTFNHNNFERFSLRPEGATKCGDGGLQNNRFQGISDFSISNKYLQLSTDQRDVPNTKYRTSVPLTGLPLDDRNRIGQNRKW